MTVQQIPENIKQSSFHNIYLTYVLNNIRQFYRDFADDLEFLNHTSQSNIVKSCSFTIDQNFLEKTQLHAEGPAAILFLNKYYPEFIVTNQQTSQLIAVNCTFDQNLGRLLENELENHLTNSNFTYQSSTICESHLGKVYLATSFNDLKLSPISIQTIEEYCQPKQTDIDNSLAISSGDTNSDSSSEQNSPTPTPSLTNAQSISSEDQEDSYSTLGYDTGAVAGLLGVIALIWNSCFKSANVQTIDPVPNQGGNDQPPPPPNGNDAHHQDDAGASAPQGRSPTRPGLRELDKDPVTGKTTPKPTPKKLAMFSETLTSSNNVDVDIFDILKLIKSDPNQKLKSFAMESTTYLAKPTTPNLPFDINYNDTLEAHHEVVTIGGYINEPVMPVAA